ncbi:unnamed protein product [Cuscuta campestris]|uniref:Uncharacterized protein n=2 Tax=Cuscuta sect. Cleistogrammica TaxID=1824901 RepID=A0A484MUA5_9ASTE|nr:hypothetical protein DM860_014292 [Cuscuta australis]VFQ92535.1 unnamed protein product [Cuscuta campestris]
MERPTFGGGDGGQGNSTKKVRKLPSPKEMVAHYEAKGLGAEEASLKAIEDLQNLLFKMAVNSGEKGSAAAAATSRKLDSMSSRLISLDMKLDSKPSYPQTLAIGVASGALVQLFPHFAGAVAGIWNSVRSVTKSNP